MEVSADYYRRVLKNKLDDLCRKNNNYSLRSFARKLDVSASTLSRVLNGQSALSIKSAEKIATILSGNAAEKRCFITSALEDYRQRNALSSESSSRPDDLKVDLLASENMSPALALLCFSIMELTFTEKFDPNPEVIAQRTGYPLQQVNAAIEVLVQTGLLKRTKKTLKKTQKSIHLKSKNGSDTNLHGFYRELFQFAAERMPTHHINTGAVVTLTLPSDPEKIELARTLIEDFSWQLCQTLTSGRMTEVYHMGIFLEPATKDTGEH